MVGAVRPPLLPPLTEPIAESGVTVQTKQVLYLISHCSSLSTQLAVIPISLHFSNLHRWQPLLVLTETCSRTGYTPGLPVQQLHLTLVRPLAGVAPVLPVLHSAPEESLASTVMVTCPY